MKLSEVAAGDLIVDAEGHLWRVLGHGVQLDAERRLPAEVMDELRIEAAPGKGGARPQVSVDGRQRYTRKGTLTLRCEWDPADDYPEHPNYTIFKLFTTGHGLLALAEFEQKWRADARRMRARSSSTQGRFTAVANPEPSVHRRSWLEPSAPFRRAELLHDKTLLWTPELEVTDDLPWLGPEGDHPVAVEDVDGARFRIQPLYLVADSNGFTINQVVQAIEEEATRAVRTRVRDALRAVARGVGSDANDVQVDVSTVTIPHHVLEALVLGDEFGIAAVLDGVAELRDVLIETPRPERIGRP